MLEEQYQRSDGRAADGATEDAAAGTPPAAPRVEGVPSEQLWRAAILAARQAALAAAELRRALAESAAATPHAAVAPSVDEVAGATVLS